jgi:hypothetical protein
MKQFITLLLIAVLTLSFGLTAQAGGGKKHKCKGYHKTMLKPKKHAKFKPNKSRTYTYNKTR